MPLQVDFVASPPDNATTQVGLSLALKCSRCSAAVCRSSSSAADSPQVLTVSSAFRALQNATGTAAPSQLYTLQVRAVVRPLHATAQHSLWFVLPQ